MVHFQLIAHFNILTKILCFGSNSSKVQMESRKLRLPSRKSLNRERLSKLHQQKWSISLDPKEFRFHLEPTQNVNELVITKLSLKDCHRFGNDSDTKRYDRRDDEYFLCALCDRWLDGICLKHPLVFVQEKLPATIPYTVFETMPPFLTLKPSTIPGAGKGIFAVVDLPVGVAFGPYSGVLSFKTAAEKSGYSWQIVCPNGRNVWIDALDIEYSNWMRFVNCARYEQEQNTIGFLYHQNIYYYTYKPIPAFTELMVWYGAEYGEYLNIPKSNKTYGPKAPRKKTSRIKRFFTKVVRKQRIELIY